MRKHCSPTLDELFQAIYIKLFPTTAFAAAVLIYIARIADLAPPAYQQECQQKASHLAAVNAAYSRAAVI
jgi:hypothetical protein